MKKTKKPTPLSVRRTPSVDEDLAVILGLSDAQTNTEAVHRALSVYADWLKLKPGTTVTVSTHTRRKAA
ncbi:hypothetical protein [Streptomyces sp. CoT10]|uniref:hypothetical protein n=1 Tax=Streptomyces sp. CoT10 TaxID=2875762 RepID=UPI001CD6F7BB|nr:hypothetical protein [Streptomyces sp. CoT10]